MTTTTYPAATLPPDHDPLSAALRDASLVAHHLAESDVDAVLDTLLDAYRSGRAASLAQAVAEWRAGRTPG